MSGMISPFQMKKSRVVSFEFNQSESTDEYESRKVSFGADYEIAEVKEVD